MADAQADREVTRLEGFSDAVFGFAITLLVVSLEVPATFDDLVATFRGVPVFGVTFALLLLVWHEHHQFFRRFAAQDGLTIWLNGALLFVVMIYIYPLKFLFTMLVGQGGVDAAARASMIRFDQIASLMVMYGVGFGSIFLLLGAMYLHAGRRAGASPEERTDAWLGAGHCGVYVVVGLLSIAVAVSGNGPRSSMLAGVAYSAIGPLQFLYHKVTAAHRQRAAA
jgi:uncharacterized membrane protein